MSDELIIIIIATVIIGHFLVGIVWLWWKIWRKKK